MRKIKEVGRTLAFDIASGAFVVAPKELLKLEPDRIYLKGSSGPMKGFTMLLGGKRMTRSNEVRTLVVGKFGVNPTQVEETIAEFERWLVKKAYKCLRKVRASVTRYDALLEVEDLICNFARARKGEPTFTNQKP